VDGGAQDLEALRDDKPSLVQRRRAARRGAGADAARGVRATANCFLSWHLVAPLLELVAAQRAQEEMDGAPIFVWNWNNLFMLHDPPGKSNKPRAPQTTIFLSLLQSA